MSRLWVFSWFGSRRSADKPARLRRWVIPTVPDDPKPRGRTVWATSSGASVAFRRLAGALHHKGLGLIDSDLERIGKELTDGKAAVGVPDALQRVVDDLGGASEEHTVSDEALYAGQ